MIVLTILGRPECHLCEQMLADLEPLVAGRATIDLVDISDDEDLTARYLFEIPVLKCGDVELARHRLDRDRLALFLANRSR
jgi:Glutaredoxin-like domain (DUF836)